MLTDNLPSAIRASGAIPGSPPPRSTIRFVPQLRLRQLVTPLIPIVRSDVLEPLPVHTCRAFRSTNPPPACSMSPLGCDSAQQVLEQVDSRKDTLLLVGPQYDEVWVKGLAIHVP